MGKGVAVENKNCKMSCRMTAGRVKGLHVTVEIFERHD